MAIYGFGSTLDGEEFKDEFFNDEKIILGWNAENAQDLYSLVSRIKIGDIIYLKTNQPGGRTVKIKGIGVVTKGFLECFIDGDYNSADITEWNSLSIKVKWIRKKEFEIEIPESSGKLTNIRAATAYEEYLPFVQEEIIKKLFKL
ncbi:MAG: hypothetical protein IJU92_02955 [Spirochaetaceae bacterium]|nr:hypothetical protein [Spirochaetaceae bacterium]